jgi:hypothetical protein
MNQSSPRTVETRTRRKAPIEPSAPHRRKKVNQKLLMLLRGGMVALVGMILVLTLILVILPIFRVRAIVVKGASEGEAELIQSELSPLIGQEILAVDGTLVSNDYIYAQKNLTKFGYIKRFKLHRGLNSLTVEILERNQLAYARINSSYYLFNADLAVLAVGAEESDFSIFPKAEMPDVSGVTVGGTITFSNAESDFSYIGVLMKALAEHGLSDRVTAIDFSQKYGVSYTLDHCAEIRIGSVEQMQIKLGLVDEIIREQGDAIAEQYTVDVSDIARGIYRPKS